ncbi:MAG: S41 family peptidase [Cyanobacteria bacterium]|nr:S41 family peptidase [Cyanobacteriota bacterium]MDA0865742.1 S41 family peptidase [Cyanobacteriota bacterium]
MAADVPAPDVMPLDDAQRQAMVMAVHNTLDHYVSAEMAAQLQADIQQRLQAGGYDEIMDVAQLADTLTVQLQSLSGDRQLQIHFSPQVLPELEAATPPTAADLAAEYEKSRLRNFDLNRVERLRGNVGYIELYGFEPPEFVGDALAAAMTLVAHTQALILDLRHNRGGSPATVALLCSYLLPAYPAVHLNDLYWRSEKITRQWWTVPHLPAPRYLDKPIYVLISKDTFSAAEECAYNLQVLKRATILGEHTTGGANPGRGYRLGDHLWMFVPTGQAINPTTGTNWSETGIIPNVKVPAELALLTAHLGALNRLFDTQPEGPQLREVQQSLLMVERQLNQKRAELISQLKRPAANPDMGEE